MHKQAIPVSRAVAAAIAVAALSLPLTSVARAAQQVGAHRVSTVTQCRIVGAVSHRCYIFHSDAAWREGLADYHGSNGG